MLSEEDRKPVVKREFRVWLNNELQEAQDTQDQVRLAKAKYLDVLDSLAIDKELIGLRDKSLKDIIGDREINQSLHFGSIFLAKEWIGSHPDSKEAEIISKQGLDASLNTHVGLWIDFMCEVVFPDAKKVNRPVGPWRQH